MSKIEDKVCEKIQKRCDVGFKKYGVTLERDDLEFVDWIVHLQEELMDAAVYSEKILSDAICTRKDKKAMKQIIEDMVYIAKQDDWDKSTSGRQLILRDAIHLLEKIES